MGKDDDGKDPPDLFDWGSTFGTPPEYLHRKDAAYTSIAAAYAVDSKNKERMVLAVISTFGATGCISDEVKAMFPKGTPYPSITARYAALDRKGYIRRNEMDTRDGNSGSQQMVMRITPLGESALQGTYPKPPRKPRKQKEKPEPPMDPLDADAVAALFV